VKEVIVANTYELKQISLSRTNTDKIDADILCRTLKMHVLSGERIMSPVTIPPLEIQDLRSLFSTYRLCKKQTTQVKNRVHQKREFALRTLFCPCSKKSSTALRRRRSSASSAALLSEKSRKKAYLVFR
jgi:transposase